MATNIITGIFIRLDKKEEEDLRGFLKDGGYEFGPEGLKNFILDAMYGQDEGESPIIKAINDNPELVRGVGSFIGGFFRKAKE